MVMSLASAVVMVPPRYFGFNPQTLDNEFQHVDADMASKRLRQTVMAEYSAMVERLTQAGLEVLELAPSSPDCPDGVFPNNWFTTHTDGRILLYPMFSQNRRQEVQPEPLAALLRESGYQVRAIEWLSPPKAGEANAQQALEGTGAVVFDHSHQRVYAALSQRCDPHLLSLLASTQGLETLSFHTRSSKGKPVYHTNVVMSIGEGVAIVCDQAIIAEQRDRVLRQLNQDHEVVTISLEQMEQHFCANILQLQNQAGEPTIVMSQRAYAGFTRAQRTTLERHGQLLVNPIPTIERIGGGSCRCMLAEVFLPKLLQPLP